MMRFITLILLATLCPFVICPAVSAGPTGADEPRHALSLYLDMARKEVYQGELVRVNVILKGAGIAVRNVGYPRLVVPGSGAVSFAAPRQADDEPGSDLVCYSFPGRFRVANPGPLRIGPATVDCEIMEQSAGSSAFFGELTPRKITITSPEKLLMVRELPAVGKPVSFRGAIGAFTLSVSAKPERVAPGEPITVVTTIRGDGDLSARHCPELVSGQVATYPGRSARDTDRLVCEQVLIPMTSSPLPPVEWAYFDPIQGRYSTARVVLGVELSDSHMNAKQPASSVPTAETDNGSGNMQPVVFVASAVVMLLVVISLIMFSRRRSGQCPTKDHAPDPEECLRDAEAALLTGDVEKFYTILFGMLQQIVGRESGLPYQGVTAPPRISSFGADALDNLFQRCQEVRYGRAPSCRAEMETDLQSLRTLVSR